MEFGAVCFRKVFDLEDEECQECEKECRERFTVKDEDVVDFYGDQNNGFMEQVHKDAGS